MTTPTTTSVVADALEAIRRQAAIDPKTLSEAEEALRTIAGLTASLRDADALTAETGEKICWTAKHSIWGDTRVKTLPQAKEKLMAIAALIPPASGESPPQSEDNPFTAKIRAMRARSETTKAVKQPASEGSDAALYAQYDTLKGAERQKFFSANRDALVRAHDALTARDRQTKASVHASVVEQYMSLTGHARADFYAKHARELHEAQRARSR